MTFYDMTSRRIVRVRAQTLDGEKRIPAFSDLCELQSVERDFGATQSLVVLKSLLPLPKHYQKWPSQHVARRIPERLIVFRIAVVSDHAGLTFLQPAVVFAEIRFHVSI